MQGFIRRKKPPVPQQQQTLRGCIPGDPLLPREQGIFECRILRPHPDLFERDQYPTHNSIRPSKFPTSKYKSLPMLANDALDSRPPRMNLEFDNSSKARWIFPRTLETSNGMACLTFVNLSLPSIMAPIPLRSAFSAATAARAVRLARPVDAAEQRAPATKRAYTRRGRLGGA